MKFFRQYGFILLFLLLLSAMPVLSLADGESCGAGKICNPLSGQGTDDLPGLIHKILVGVLKIGLPLVALAIIYAGFLFVAARGNSEKLSTAKDTLLYTLIGAAILLGSVALAKLIEETVKAIAS